LSAFNWFGEADRGQVQKANTENKLPVFSLLIFSRKARLIEHLSPLLAQSALIECV